MTASSLLLAAAALTALAALAAAAPPATAPPALPALPPVLAANATAKQQDEALVWWQTRALDTGDMLPRAVFEDVLQRHHQQQQAAPQPPVEGRRALVGTVALAAEQGYSADNFTVRTPDGYLLTLFRLANPGRPVVFLAHALLGSSVDFLLLGKGRALAPLLHDAGFDVWLFNARGTTPSKKHESMEHHPWHSRFWDFTWHEIGYSDLSSTIDFVLKATSQSQVHFVGYCQGATSFFVLGSERPEYMDKIKTFVGLAPVAFARDVRSFPVRLFSLAPSKVTFLMKLFGVNEFLPSSKLMALLSDMLCAESEVYAPVCSNVLFLIFGTDTEQMNTTILPEFFANSPAGASTKQLLHYGQLVNHKHQTFRQFDYGRAGNLKKYGQSKPPDYNLSRVTVPAYLFYSENDIICVQSNIDELSKRLPNIPAGGLRKVAHGRFTHLDYILARNAKELVYDDVIDILRKSEDAGSTTLSSGSTVTPSASPPSSQPPPSAYSSSPPLSSTPSPSPPSLSPPSPSPPSPSPPSPSPPSPPSSSPPSPASTTAAAMPTVPTMTPSLAPGPASGPPAPSSVSPTVLAPLVPLATAPAAGTEGPSSSPPPSASSASAAAGPAATSQAAWQTNPTPSTAAAGAGAGL